MLTLPIKSNKFPIALVLLGLFGLCSASPLSFNISALVLGEKSAHARPALRDVVGGALKFLGTEIAKGAVAAGVVGILSPKKAIADPLPSNRNTTQSIYAGSYFQCSKGCKYYWDPSTGWLSFDSQQESWKRIRFPSTTVARTHDVYMDYRGSYFTKAVAPRDGFSPQYGWVIF